MQVITSNELEHVSGGVRYTYEWVYNGSGKVIGVKRSDGEVVWFP